MTGRVPARSGGAAAATLIFALGLPCLSAVTGRPTLAAPSSPARSAIFDQGRALDVNRLGLPMNNAGDFGNPLSFPAGGPACVFTWASLWLGARVGGEVRTAGGGYTVGYAPGAMVGGFPDDPHRPQYRVYKVRRWTGSPADTARVTRAAGAGAERDTLVHHSWSDYLAGAAPHGAPTRLWRLPNTSTPDPTDSVDVSGPDVCGDVMLWAVYNDAATAPDHLPLGVEVQQSAFAFERSDALGNVVFLEFRIMNKGSNRLDSMFVSLWADPDVGGVLDDLVGVDTSAALGFAYNATNDDYVYGARPPAVGYDLMLGPVVRATGEMLGMTAFNGYPKPVEDIGTPVYDLIRALDASGRPATDPTTGLPSPFTFTGDPVAGTGWLAVSLHDPRMALSSGPFTMAPGDTQRIVGAIVVGQGADRLASIEVLRLYDRIAQRVFERGFAPAVPPSAPKVEAVVSRDTLTLCWDGGSLDYRDGGYAFQGFNVFQGATPAGPWTRLATYDRIDRVRLVEDEVFDPATGQVRRETPVAYGSDAGLQFCHGVTRDTLRGCALLPGTEYYFAVSAYAFGPGERPKVIESPLAVVSAIPQGPPLGTVPAAASALPVRYVRLDPLAPPTTDRVTVEVVDPARVTGHTYQVTFAPLDPPFSGLVAGDTATVRFGWNLVDATAGRTLLARQVNRRGGDDYQAVDGLRVREVGVYFPAMTGAQYLPLPNSFRRLRSVNAGLPFFFGGAGPAKGFLGSALDPAVSPDSFTTVEVRFHRSVTQKAYRFLRLEKAGDGSPPPQGRGYLYGGFFTVPFTVWDTANAVQLEAAFVERTLTDSAGTILPAALQPATRDSTWDPDTSATGGHEYLFVIRRLYGGAPESAFARDGAIADGSLPELFALWARLWLPEQPAADGEAFRFDWAVPASANDVFEFDTRPEAHGVAEEVRRGLSRIRVVPNPYRLISGYDRAGGRVVRFLNMPEVATVRIFNLSGERVRTLHKTDPTSSVLEWDLLTDHGRNVASGIYVYRVEVPGVASTFGRMVVFMGP